MAILVIFQADAADKGGLRMNILQLSVSAAEHSGGPAWQSFSGRTCERAPMCAHCTCMRAAGLKRGEGHLRDHTSGLCKC
jgi:hypothetical protein